MSEALEYFTAATMFSGIFIVGFMAGYIQASLPKNRRPK